MPWGGEMSLFSPALGWHLKDKKRLDHVPSSDQFSRELQPWLAHPDTLDPDCQLTLSRALKKEEKVLSTHQWINNSKEKERNPKDKERQKRQEGASVKEVKEGRERWKESGVRKRLWDISTLSQWGGKTLWNKGRPAPGRESRTKGLWQLERWQKIKATPECC